MRISGRVIFESIGTGAWMIEDQNGKRYLPVNMPEQLKLEGEQVRIVAKPSEEASLIMMGTPIEITSFHTLPKLG